MTDIVLKINESGDKVIISTDDLERTIEDGPHIGKKIHDYIVEDVNAGPNGDGWETHKNILDAFQIIEVDPIRAGKVKKAPKEKWGEDKWLLPP
jgi:hypothetical protein